MLTRFSITAGVVSAGLVLLLLLVLILLPFAPSLHPFPDRDSSIFLYIGQRILHGEMPYRDVWDHKGPLIYYLDAAALGLFGGSLWGVWVLQVLSLGIAVALSYRLFQRLIGPRPALIATLAWLISLPLVMLEGNSVEEYALPLQFALLLIFVDATRGDRRHVGWRWFLLGVIEGLAILLRPNIIGIAIAIVVTLVLLALLDQDDQRFRRLLRQEALIALGALTPIVIVASYFASRGAFDELVDASIRYNLIYSQTEISERIKAMIAGIRYLGGSGIIVLATVSWFIIAGQTLRVLRRHEDIQPLWIVALFAFPIEVLLAASSGREYQHYYITWLPILSVLVAFLIEQARVIVRTSRVSPTIVRGGVVGGLFVMSVVPAMALLDRYQEAIEERDDYRQQVVDYIGMTVEEDATVLVWGSEAGYHVVSNNPSPTTYVYQYPLYTPDYQTDEMVNAFLTDLQVSAPAIVIDVSPLMSRRVPPIDPNVRANWEPAS